MSASHLSISPLLPAWLIALLLGLALAAGIAQFLSLRRRVRPARAALLSLLRLAALGILLSFLLNPVRVERREGRSAPVLAVVVDTSRSMALAGRPGRGTRLDEARAVLAAGDPSLANTLSKHYEVRFYSLGETLREMDSKDLPGLAAGGKQAKLETALEGLSGKAAAVLLLSDGNFRGDEETRKDLPVFTLSAGDRGTYRDVLIRAVKAPSLAFRDRPVTIEAVIRGYGHRGLRLPVVLKEGGRILAAKTVVLEGDPADTAVSFSFTPEEVGQRHLLLSISPPAGEGSAGSNAVPLSLRVVRDKIRILMVSGVPSLTYRHMRTAFKNDPSVDLLSFVILRTPTDIMNVPLQEQSLIPFPVEALFSKELKNFDLLIFDNFLYHLYSKPVYLAEVREFVRAGGGFAMIGGPSLLDEGNYVGTALEEVLPFRLSGKENYRRAAPARVRISPKAGGHPLVRFGQASDDEGAVWKEMPALEGINLLEPKAPAAVLLETADAAGRPLLIAGSYGKGRTLALATDESWKWSMGPVARGQGNWAYLRFVERAARWLTRDPGLGPVQIALPETLGKAGEEIELRIRVTAETPSSGRREAPAFSVTGPDGVRIGGGVTASERPGEFVAVFSAAREGVYRARAETAGGAVEESIFIPGEGERVDSAPDPERLARVAAATGGKALPGREEAAAELEKEARRQERRFVEETRRPLWSSVYIMAGLLSLFSAEWFLRRRWGLT